MILGIGLLNTVERTQANLQEFLMKTRKVLFVGMTKLLGWQYRTRTARLQHIALEKEALSKEQDKLVDAVIEYSKKAGELQG